MGIYDTYMNKDQTVCVQMKVGDVDMSNYSEGDPAPLPDGVYYGHEGTVVIRNGVVAQVTEAKHVVEFQPSLQHFTKWGDEFSPATESLDDHHPIIQALKALPKS